nr:sterol O-acyltransferase 1-like [Zootoca vivipara]
MVGKENISVRNRQSTYETSEEKEDLSKRLEVDWSSSQSSNGRVDVDHLVTRKMQLLVEAEQMKPAFMERIDSHFTEFVNGLIAKSVQLESSPPAFSAEKDGGFKSKGSRASLEHGKVFVLESLLGNTCFLYCSPGILMTIFIYFLLFHYWLNAFAEMLRFADRMFYKDWWNSTSYARYYRTWNVVVHDWLFYYAYKDFLWLFGGKSKAVAMLSVFTLSAIVHEYVLAVCLGYFYPVLFCFFMGFGMVFNFILNDRRKGPIWNVILWSTFILGLGILFCLYTQEWYAHKHCPLENPTFFDYVKPRSWTCHLKV